MKVKIRRRKIIQARTEILLCHLMHIATMYLRFRKSELIRMAFEENPVPQRLHQRLARLKRGGYIDDEEDVSLNAKVYRMTDYGRLIALGGIDPTFFWNSTWDGKWRIVSFDVPETRRSIREDLRDTLRVHHFGRLQQSLWVTPHRLGDELLNDGIEVSSLNGLAVIEGVFFDQARNEDIVAESWHFEEINDLYREHEQFLKSLPKKGAAQEIFFGWLDEELYRWKGIAERDPFLPRCLWPQKYLGEKIWNKRLEVLRLVHKNFPQNSQKKNK